MMLLSEQLLCHDGLLKLTRNLLLLLLLLLQHVLLCPRRSITTICFFLVLLPFLNFTTFFATVRAFLAELVRAEAVVE